MGGAGRWDLKYNCKGCEIYDTEKWDPVACPFYDCEVRKRVKELPLFISAARMSRLLGVSRPTVLSRFEELEEQNLAYRDGRERRIKRDALLRRPLCDVPLKGGGKK